MSGLPGGWSEGTGADAFTLVRGVSYDKNEVCAEPGPDLIPVLRATNIQNGQIIPSDLVYVPSKYVSPGQLLRPGDLLIATSSGSRDVVGKTATAGPEHGRFAFGAFCSVARPNGTAHSGWIAYYTQSRAYRDYVERVALGININNFRTRDLAALPIPLAPISEQQRIVARLDGLVARSKTACVELSRIPRLIERYKQAVLAAAFRGDLTAAWRQGNPSSVPGGDLLAEVVARRERLATKSGTRGGPSPPIDLRQVAQYPPLPDSWAWIPVEILSLKVADGVHKKPEYVETGIKFLTVRNLTAGPGITFDGCRYVTERDHLEFIKRTHPERGDILISKDGTLGIVRAIRTDEVFSVFVSLALVKPLDRSMTDYLELAFCAPQVQGQMVGVGTGLQHIHLTDLRRDLIPVAPVDERAEIVRRVHSLFEQIDGTLAEASRAGSLLKRLDQAIFAKAFRGELEPSDGQKIIDGQREAG
jgi:type I restriction enzyme S subunit